MAAMSISGSHRVIALEQACASRRVNEPVRRRGRLPREMTNMPILWRQCREERGV